MSLHTIYLAIIAGVAIALTAFAGWWHHDAVLEGMAKCQAAQKAALEKQHNEDLQANEDAVAGLEADKRALQAELASQPPPALVCKRVLYVHRPLPPGTSAPATPPSQPAQPPDDRGVPPGGGGGDVGPGVRALAAAGELVADYEERLYEWAVKTR